MAMIFFLKLQFQLKLFSLNVHSTENCYESGTIMLVSLKHNKNLNQSLLIPKQIKSKKKLNQKSLMCETKSETLDFNLGI